MVMRHLFIGVFSTGVAVVPKTDVHIAGQVSHIAAVDYPRTIVVTRRTFNEHRLEARRKPVL
jgi:hypothetical protein